MKVADVGTDGYRLPYTAGAVKASMYWRFRYSIFAFVLLVPLLAFWGQTVIGYSVEGPVRYLFGCLPIFLLFASNSILLRKTSRDRCKILLLRSFDPQTARDARQVVIPFLGMYGRIVTAVDGTLHSSWSLPVLATREIAQDISTHVSLEDESWRANIVQEIQSADIVVADISLPKTAVLWEVEQGLRFLPPYRMLFIASYKRDPSNALPTLERLLSRYGLQLNQGQQTILAYGGSVKNDYLFARSLKHLMRVIGQQRVNR